MEFHKQLFRHDPDNGVYGDCHRTAIACLLNLAPEEVPHWGQLQQECKGGPDAYDWRAECETWLNSKGYTQMDYCFFPDNLDNFFLMMEDRQPQIVYLMGGKSPRGTNHTVVCKGGGFEWDPHPDGGFLVGPMSNKVYEATFLLPLNMKVSEPR